MNNQQLVAYNLIKRGKNVFVTGPGGTGKSTFIDYVRNLPDINTGVTAMTGCAAILIKGQTLHSFLGIGLGMDSSNDIIINMRAKAKKTWVDLQFLIIDEVSMLNPELLDKLNIIAQSLKANDKPFGGIQLLFSGDLYQLPCVKAKTFFTSTVTFKSCNFNIIVFTEIMRQKDVVFKTLLNKFRNGTYTANDISFLKQECKQTKKLSIPPTRLFCINKLVDDFNDMKLDALKTEINTYEYSSTGTISPSLLKSCSIKETLRLGIGAQVLLIYNMDLMSGLVNGSRGNIIGFSFDKLPIVEFLNGITLVIQPYVWEIKQNKTMIGTITQIPLRLAYAITIHKSQGMTLDSVLVNLKGVFEKGQAYVALSRVKTMENLVILNLKENSFKIHPEAKEFYTLLN